MFFRSTAYVLVLVGIFLYRYGEQDEFRTYRHILENQCTIHPLGAYRSAPYPPPYRWCTWLTYQRGEIASQMVALRAHSKGKDAVFSAEFGGNIPLGYMVRADKMMLNYAIESHDPELFMCKMDLGTHSTIRVPKEITVGYLNETFQPQTHTFRGMDACLVYTMINV